MKGTIVAIETLEGFSLSNVVNLDGKNNVRLGVFGMLNNLSASRSMDGYKVKTTEHIYLILIDNEQNCCETWGYFSTNDNLQEFIGSELTDIELTDKSLKTEAINELEYLDEGSVQFVTFKTEKGDFQLAVYNGHNGYYGHGIIIAEDDKILLQTTI